MWALRGLRGTVLSALFGTLSILLGQAYFAETPTTPLRVLVLVVAVWLNMQFVFLFLQDAGARVASRVRRDIDLKEHLTAVVVVLFALLTVLAVLGGIVALVQHIREGGGQIIGHILAGLVVGSICLGVLYWLLYAPAFILYCVFAVPFLVVKNGTAVLLERRTVSAPDLIGRFVCAAAGGLFLANFVAVVLLPARPSVRIGVTLLAPALYALWVLFYRLWRRFHHFLVASLGARPRRPHRPIAARPAKRPAKAAPAVALVSAATEAEEAPGALGLSVPFAARAIVLVVSMALLSLGVYAARRDHVIAGLLWPDRSVSAAPVAEAHP